MPPEVGDRIRSILGEDPDAFAHRFSQMTGQSAAEVISYLSASFSGPYPPPEMLAAYERVVPGLAERLIRQGESQTAHRQEMERQLMGEQRELRRDTFRLRSLGLVLGALIVLAVMAAAVLMTRYGHPLTGGLLGGGGIIGLAAVFVYGSRMSPQKTDAEQPPASTS